jgi:ketosteroid isomerase-like protein
MAEAGSAGHGWSAPRRERRPVPVWTVEDWVSDGVKLAVRASLKATIAATGEAYENSYTFFYRLEDLRIAESWEAFDTAFAADRLRPQRDAT